MPKPPSRDLRGYRRATDRQLLFGFFALLFLVGGGLIYAFYGGAAAALGAVCMAAGAGLVGVLFLVMLGLEWLSHYLDRND